MNPCKRPGRLPLRALLVPLALALPVVVCGTAQARPNYFEAFVDFYGLTPGQDLYACGVCHLRWEGTGARNPYGTAVEQQLYINAKPIIDAIRDIEDVDTDLDGFTNVEELVTHGTLPGYSCDNFTIALDTPENFQALITPLVPSCLEPMDVRVAPIEVSFLTKVGTSETVDIEVINNGTDAAITVGAYQLVPGTTSGLSVGGPPLPIVIPVGQSATLELTFAPAAAGFLGETLRISSDDPDEPAIDVPIGGVSFFPNLAPPAKRAACQQTVERRFEGLARAHLGEWGSCYLDELRGVACDPGRRDLSVARAEARLHAALGGAADRNCAGAGLTPTLLGLPDACGGGCGAIAIDTLGDWADCLACRQREATSAMLEATLGSAPPDLPADVVGAVPHRCARALVKRMQRAITSLQKRRAACELRNVAAASPVDCAAALAPDVARLTAKVGAALDRCPDTTGLDGCRFAPGADPSCLASAAAAIADGLVEAVFETE
ncbi:MAG: hypothetical protein AB1689_01775 [Thermodesulfobacteriota bacterium]